MKKARKYLPYFLIIILFVSAFFIWSKIQAQNNQSDYLTVAFLDVGQGDAIFIQAPNGKQMLIDGGPDGKVLQRLGEIMPFGDKSIDILLATHSDMDHIGGFPLVLDNYKVSNIIENGATSDTKIYEDLTAGIIKKKVKKIIAHGGMRIILDQKKDIYFDILFPDRDVSNLESNDGSIVGKLVYGQESFMLTGDATIYDENIIGWNEKPETIQSKILKLGHHGSHTSSSFLWLKEVNPEIAIISVDKNNRYGHPHEDILDRLKSLDIPYLMTSEEGNIIFQTNGDILIKK